MKQILNFLHHTSDVSGLNQLIKIVNTNNTQRICLEINFKKIYFY